MKEDNKDNIENKDSKDKKKTKKGVVNTNFGSIVLDDHSSRKIYIPKMIVDIQSYIHLR